MLTKEAFNALLKTLEEPPAHVVFILATTEAHKLPETIISRTQRYSFRPIPKEQVVAHLKTIAGSEKMKIDDDALELIAEHGEGSFRDSISLLDQAGSAGGQITRAQVESLLGHAPAELIDRLLAAVTDSDSAGIVSTLSTLHGQGYEPAMVASQLAAPLRRAVLDGTARADTLELLRSLLDVPAARQPKQLLELVLLQSALRSAADTPAARPAATPKPLARQVETVTDTVLPEQPAAPAQDTAPQVFPPTEERPAANPPADPPGDVLELWQRTLDEIKRQHNTLYGIARMATPELDGDKLTLHLKFAFHQKRLNEAKNRKIISDVAERLSGHPLEIICIVAESSEPTPAKADVSAISNIFGGAELLES
jgi:DNA polymerase-3 subunit gamma/tau